ncbi:E3 SUMO-protein ligase RanBP2-like [Haemaphysalis longicornis]
MGNSPSQEARGVDDLTASDDNQLEPVAALGDSVGARTDSESEELPFCHWANLPLFGGCSKQWRDPAMGEIKTLEHKRPCADGQLASRQGIDFPPASSLPDSVEERSVAETAVLKLGNMSQPPLFNIRAKQ